METPAPSLASRTVILALSVMFGIVAAFGIATVALMLWYAYGWIGLGEFAAVIVGLASLVGWRLRRS